MSGYWKYIGNRPFEEEIDRRTSEQIRSDDAANSRQAQQFRSEIAQKQYRIAGWNVSGQYAKIGEFVFPVVIEDVYDPLAFGAKRHHQAKITIGDQRLTVFRLVSADESTPWLMKREFGEQTGVHPFLNVVSSPWW